MIIMQECPFVKISVSNHKELKPKILDAIGQMGTHSMFYQEQRISNSDWHLNPQTKRPYYEIVYPIIEKHIHSLKTSLNMDYELIVTNYWFQQYEKKDCHPWHTHGACVFSSVYYVELPSDASKTKFRMLGKEFELDVMEGDILTFPSFYEHCSAPNNSNKRKTIVSFNLA